VTRTTLLNAGAALLSLALSAAVALLARGSHAGDARLVARVLSAAPAIVREDGRAGLRDVSGRFVPIERYQRIVSTNGVTDSVLLALVEPPRIAAFSRFSASGEPYGYKYAGKPLLTDLSDLEAIVALRPDLVLVNSLGSADRIARLREAGLCVFDLGEMRGMLTLPSNIVTVAALIGRAELGRAIAAQFERRMRALAQAIPEARRPRGLYVSIYGDAIYGGADGTSYHDVLEAAGLRDAAAGRFRDWPRYTPETLLTLDPDVIVTHTGMARALCAHEGLAALRACRGRRVVEVSGSLLDEPSLAMLDAAEVVYDAVHGSSGAARHPQRSGAERARSED
jgi:ABC-type Fe3+-hydroxamate transport system substrate-binding protein